MVSVALKTWHDGASPIVEDDAGAGVARVLAAIIRLLNASAIELLACSRDGSGPVLLAAVGDRPALECPLVQAAMTEWSARGPVGPDTQRWVDGKDGNRVLVRLPDQPDCALFLLLTLPDRSLVVRAHLKRSIPDIVTLTWMYLDSEMRMQATEELAKAHTEALDHGECGVIAIRADHSILFANAAAKVLLTYRTGLCVRRNVLRPVDHAGAIRFEAALDSVIETSGRDRTKRARANVMMLEGTREDPASVIVVITPAGQSQEPEREARGAVAIIYLLKGSHATDRGLDTLCRLHGLSRVETHLIGHLMDGQTLGETALRMRIKNETARAYLKQVFAKTGIHRQSDLIAQMTRYQRAIRGDFDFQAS